MIKDRRRAMLINAISSRSKLPKEYQEVEWLRGSGTQYCQTAYYAEYQPNSITGIKGDVTVLGFPAAFCIGSISLITNNYGFGLYKANGQNKANFYYGDVRYNHHEFNIIFTQSRADIHYEINPTSIIFNNSTIERPEANFTSNVPISIGSFYGNGQSIMNESTLLKKFGIYKNDVLLTEVIPCYRKADGKSGFYQTKVPTGSSNFITNLASGVDFQVGPDVTSEG